MIKASCEGKIFGGLVDCYVLEDGSRVVSQTSVIRALRGADGDRAKDGDLGRYLARLPSDYAPKTIAPIAFIPPQGGRGLGLDAESFVEILRSYKKAGRAGALHHTQAHLAEQADSLLDALAGVAIVAMIDEATGFQRVRADGALAAIFNRFFGPKPAPWEQMFSSALVNSLCKLDGVKWSGGRHPSYLKSTNKKIYEMVCGSEIFAEMRRRNPLAHFGSNHHQLMSEEAREAFREQLTIVQVIADQSRSKNDFWRRMERQYGTGLLQLELGELAAE